MRRAILIATVLLLTALGERTQSQAMAAWVEARVPFPPAPIANGGVTYLGYELHVTNFYRDTGSLHLRRFQVFADEDSTPLLTRADADAAEYFWSPGTDRGTGDNAMIPGGMRGVLYVWVALPLTRAIPATLRHVVAFRTEDGQDQVLDGPVVTVRGDPTLVVGAPFRDGLWVATNAPGNHRAHHWGTIIAENGAIGIPQRFATDWLGVNADGRATRIDFRKAANDDWVGYGKDVLAIADGVVRDVRDGQPDNAPGSPAQEVPPSLEAGGNYLLLELGNQVFAYYGHLQPNSLTVSVGHRVRRGQAIGRVGNSGNSNAPHLHLHLMTGPSFRNSEGLPFLFDRFLAMGLLTQERAAFGEGSAPAAFKPQPRERELPLQNDVVSFR